MTGGRGGGSSFVSVVNITNQTKPKPLSIADEEDDGLLFLMILILFVSFVVFMVYYNKKKNFVKLIREWFEKDEEMDRILEI